MFLRFKRGIFRLALVLAGLGAMLTAAEAGAAAHPAPILDLARVDRGAAALDGNWQFHIGDDPAWAAPELDDSEWEPIRVDAPWGAQSHFAYAGFGWYRRHLRITAAPGTRPELELLMPVVMDAYEVYWNGALIGHVGTLPPHANWPASPIPQIFGFPGTGEGVLAIRVWKSPMGSTDSGLGGGLLANPLLGDAISIAASKAVGDYAWLRSNLYSIGLNYLYGAAALLALAMWLRRRSEVVLLWFAIFTGYPLIAMVLYGLRLPIPSTVAATILQPLFALGNVSVWFLLLYLLRLESNRTLVRWTKILAVISVTAGMLDGIVGLTYFVVGWSEHLWIEWADAVLTAVTTLLEAFPLIVVAIGIRRKLDATRWVVVSAAFVSQMILVVVSSSVQGERFTHWTLGYRLSTPIFFVQGMYFNAQILADTAFFLSVLYAIYRYGKEQSGRQSLLELEILRAREIQQILIPKAITPLEGYAITSAYQPAREVGGDFFQVIPCEDGSALIALGDVSGKGLQAAMSVAMILGVLQALADLSSSSTLSSSPVLSLSPAKILAGLNARMHGRMGDGFATAVIARIDSEGGLMLASAGHMPPFLNRDEVELPGSLPLGLMPGSSYEETVFELRPGDQLTFYTDGLLEARSHSGELYGFERVRTLFASRPTAAEATQAAIQFGQDDDITVLTLTRLAEGEESSAMHTAPAFVQA